MKILPDSPPSPHAFPSSFRNSNPSFEIEICADSFRTVNSDNDCTSEEGSIDDYLPRERPSLRSSSYGAGTGFSGYGADNKAHKLCRPHQFKASTDWKDDDDEDDGMQWANSVGPVQTARQSSGYSDGKDRVHEAKIMAYGKENKVRIPCKLPSSIAQRQHAGPIKPNSGPFSGPLKATGKVNFVGKANMAPSIIPVNLKCRKMFGLDIREPMSPEVTCLGRIRIKESHNKGEHDAMAADKPGAIAQKTEKGRCFDAKNQLCGKRPKGRKKKKIAEKSRCLSRRRRFASKEAAHSQSFSSSVSLELGETRREKAASLAKSLTDLLEDVRRLDKDKANYVPNVPPPNSLLLMRGGRKRMDDQSCSPSRLNVDEATSNDVIGPLQIEVLDEEGCCEPTVENFRNSTSLHLSLLDLIDMDDEGFSLSEMEGTMATQNTTHAEVQCSSVCERDDFEAVEKDDMKNKCTTDDSPQMQPPKVVLWRRRAFVELTPIIVEQCAQRRQ